MTDPDQCSSFISGVDYMGISNAPSGKAWQFQLLPASDAANCCAQCYKVFPDGCQGWAFLPWNVTRAPCNIVYNWTSSHPDASCPQGVAYIAFGLSKSPEYNSSVGGAGPCGVTASASRSRGRRLFDLAAAVLLD